MTLREWLAAHHLTDGAFARRIAASESAVRRWRVGERWPRPKAMRRITEATNGAVTPNDFFTQEAAE